MPKNNKPTKHSKKIDIRKNIRDAMTELDDDIAREAEYYNKYKVS